jgi:DNA polymerase-1
MAHYVEGLGSTTADFFVVAECPDPLGPSSDTERHVTWNRDTEKMVRKIVKEARESPNHAITITEPGKLTRHTMLECRFTYAIRCAIEAPAKPKKEHWTCCTPLFHKELEEYSKPNTPIFILALGTTVLKSLNIKFGKYQVIQGRLIKTELNGRTVYILPTVSKRQLLAKAGYIDLLKIHTNALLTSVRKAHLGESISVITPAEELTKNYIFPNTVKEVAELVEYIAAYQEFGNPDNHPISLDTEVNTLYPHRDKTKILTLTVAWAEGRAASIPLEHSETPWALAEVEPYIVALLRCKKPKVFHNGKYDLKVFNSKGWHVHRPAWDTMLGEHLLAEDKRGYYSLKILTANMLPKYAGYEDELKELLKILEEQGALLKGHNTLELTGAEKKLEEDVGFEFVPLKLLNTYGAIDADVTRQICGIQRHRMLQEERKLIKARAQYKSHSWFPHLSEKPCPSPQPLVDLMYQRSIPATKTLAKMEYVGMGVDRDYLIDLRGEMDRSIAKLQFELQKMVPAEVLPQGFNPNSTAQLQKILFVLGYRHPVTGAVVSYGNIIPDEERKKTASGALSTDATLLKLLKNHYKCPFATELLNYRALTKARGTYVENIFVLSKEDRRMHTTFHIPGTATGRLSSSNENMQNIPMFIAKHNIKKIFTAENPSSQVIVNADAKAAEVRIYAAYSKDPNLIRALNDGMDPHSFFAATVYNPASVLTDVPVDKRKEVLTTVGIDDEHAWSYADFQNRGALTTTDPNYAEKLEKLRKTIKRVVFGILYGAGRGKIASIVGIPAEQAQAIITVLYRMFPTIPAYIKRTEQQVEQLGIVETFLGRRRRFDYKNMEGYIKAKAKRQAVNFKIQGTSSDIVLDVLCSVDDVLTHDFGGRLNITVHDSLVFELPNQYISQMPDFINEYGVKQVARKYPWLPVPFQWDVEVGKSYGELQAIPSFLKNHPEMTQLEDTDYFDNEEINMLLEVQTA